MRAMKYLGCIVILVAACADDPHKRGLGSTCDADAQCASGLCLESRCFLPDGDDDGDGLSNALEGALGTSPTLADSDHDGIPDRDELALDLTAVDSDGDGIIDALESAVADQDFDCLPDQLDPRNTVADPNGCALPDNVQVDCFDQQLVRHAASGPSLIDPDGVGGAAALEVDCEQTLANGGWTPLVAGVLPATFAGVSEYLFTNGSDWLQSPLVAHGWSYDAGDAGDAVGAAPGQWLTSIQGFVSAIVCDGSAAPSGVGIGCAEADGGAIRIASGDPTNATVRLCLDPGISPFPLDADGCVDGIEGYWRRSRCRDVGAIVGDAQLTTLPSSACWEPVVGNTGTVAGASDAPAGSSQGSFVVTGETAWRFGVIQRGLTFVGQQRYRLSVWMKGTASGSAFVSVLIGSDHLLRDAVPYDTTWRRYEVGFTATSGTVAGQLDLDFAHDAGMSVLVNGLRIAPLDASACTPAAGELTGGDTFDEGDVCWSVFAGQNAFVSAATPTELASGEAAPVLQLERTPLEQTSPFTSLAQVLPALSQERLYRMHGWFRTLAGSATTRLHVFDADISDVATSLASPITTDWTRVEQPFVLYGPAATTLEGATFEAETQLGDGAIVQVDGLGVSDAGPTPCVPRPLPIGTALDRDSTFDEGLLCWQQAIVSSARGHFIVDPSGERPNGAPPWAHFVAGTLFADSNDSDVALVQSGIPLQGGHDYYVSFWGKGAEATTMALVVRDADGTTLDFEPLNVPADWSQFGFAFQPTVDTTNATVRLEVGASPVDVYIDDVIVSEQTL